MPSPDADPAADLLIALREPGVSISSSACRSRRLDEVFLALTGHGTDEPRRPTDDRNWSPHRGAP